MVKIIFKPNYFDIFSKKEQIAAARTNSHGQAHIATACGVPLDRHCYSMYGYTLIPLLLQL
jgi:hypothetical protein